MSDSTQPKGLYKKFYVERVDGRDKPGGDRENAQYLVLDLVHDRHALPALAAYARAVEEKYPKMAKDLLDFWTKMHGEDEKIPGDDDHQRIIGEWADKTFPHATPRSMVMHINDELMELAMALIRDNHENIREEVADIYGILCHIAHRIGFSIYVESVRKHAFNLRREWLPPDEHGVSRHDPTKDAQG